jgi:hypothetical protein
LFLQVSLDRAAYHYRIERSIHFKQSLSMVVDGADMSRYSVPYFCIADKESAEGECNNLALHCFKIELYIRMPLQFLCTAKFHSHNHYAACLLVHKDGRFLPACMAQYYTGNSHPPMFSLRICRVGVM